MPLQVGEREGYVMTYATRVKCGNCQNYHSSAAEVRLCYFPPVVQQPPAMLAQSALASVERPSQRQLDFIRDLGGDVQMAMKYTKRGASLYIDRLKREGKTAVTTAPNRQQTKIPLEMLHDLPDGYYASRPDSEHPYTFFRVSRPKSGNFNGALKIQTQHGPDYKLALVVYPGDRIYWSNLAVEDDLLLVVVDRNGCAIAYADKIGRCMRCNTELTDERSRWYGIGPECEKHWPQIIDIVNDRKGVFKFGA